jgi:hypothetical protein
MPWHPGECRDAVKNRDSCDFRHIRLAACALVCKYCIRAKKADPPGSITVRAFCLVIFLSALGLRILASALDTGAEAATPARAPVANTMALPQR